jgi:hypothetical protein
MYQCVASSDGESVQATAELRLGGKWQYVATALKDMLQFSVLPKQSSPATRHTGAWGERSIAPTHS